MKKKNVFLFFSLLLLLSCNCSAMHMIIEKTKTSDIDSRIALLHELNEQLRGGICKEEAEINSLNGKKNGYIDRWIEKEKKLKKLESGNRCCCHISLFGTTVFCCATFLYALL